MNFVWVLTNCVLTHIGGSAEVSYFQHLMCLLTLFPVKYNLLFHVTDPHLKQKRLHIHWNLRVLSKFYKTINTRSTLTLRLFVSSLDMLLQLGISWRHMADLHQDLPKLFMLYSVINWKDNWLMIFLMDYFLERVPTSKRIKRLLSLNKVQSGSSFFKKIQSR